jgi:protein-glutamine gamma-glutamyltransferase
MSCRSSRDFYVVSLIARLVCLPRFALLETLIRRIAHRETYLMPPTHSLSLFQYRYTLAALLAAVLPALLWLSTSTSLIVLSILAVRFFTVRSSPKVWPAWLRVVLVVFLTYGIILQFGGLTGRAAGGALLITMMALKATETHERRHARVLVMTALFALIASFLMQQSIFALMLTVLATGMCFAALEVLSRPALGPQHSPFGRIDFANLAMLALALPLAGLLWLLFPRFASPVWGTEQGTTGKMGLSSTMQIGALTELLADDSPAFRVRFTDGRRPPTAQLYFRGPVLWKLSNSGEWSAMYYFNRTTTPPPKPQPSDLQYEVVLEPSDMRFLFVADQGVSVDLEASYSTEYSFTRRTPVTELTRYNARSKLVDRVPLGPYPSLQRAEALRLPSTSSIMAEPQTRALAQSWAQENPDPMALVLRALNYFRNENFVYNLSPPDLTEVNRTDDFLFNTREGYCEYYSHAFAFLMRAAGVPTRVVTGFAGGHYPDGADYLLVTNSNAHAWNEVLINDEWIRVDPTAVIPQERIVGRGFNQMPEAGFWQSLADWRDRGSDWWNRAVLGFNAQRQAGLLRPFGIEYADWGTLMRWLGTAMAACVALWMLLLWLKRPASILSPTVREYHRLQRTLKSQGLTLITNATPSAQLAHAAQQWPQLKPELEQLAANMQRLLYTYPEQLNAQGKPVPAVIPAHESTALVTELVALRKRVKQLPRV